MRRVSDLDVAIIIVTYRSARLTVDCLHSLDALRAAPGPRFRAIVVDNSRDDLTVIRPAVEANNWSSWVTLLQSPKNGGFAYGNNLGIAHAYADKLPDYFYMLNPDTQVRPGAIASLVDFLESHPEVGIAGGSYENGDGSDWPIAFRFPSVWSEVDSGLAAGIATRLLQRWVTARRMTKTPQPVDWICGAAMMVRRSVLSAIGGFDEQYFLYYEETDFCRRAKQAGFPTWYVPESRVMHIAGQSTGVSDISDAPRRPQRLPKYWFESRRRYFATTFGKAHARMIDIISILANAIGYVKRIVSREMHCIVPHYIRDLIRYSVLWPRNGSFPPVKCDLPRS